MFINEVKERIDIKEVINRYSISQLNKNNKTICPFHNDTKPSLSVKGQRFKCFVCDAGGDAIDFVSHLYGLKPLDAAKMINCDFALGLETTNKTSMLKAENERKRRQEELMSKKQKEEKENFIFDCYCDIYKAKQKILQQRNINSIPTKEWISAFNICQWLDYYFDNV